MNVIMGRFIGATAAMSMLAWPAQAQDSANKLVMMLKDECKVTIDMRPDLAPKHVEQIKALTKQGFYDGIVFHRVIEGFMAQTGDPTGTGTGGSDLPDIPAEFSQEPFVRGTVGMARSMNRIPRTASSSSCLPMAVPERGLHSVG